MFSFFRNLFKSSDQIVYIRFRRDKVSFYYYQSGVSYEDEPMLAIKKKGKKEIVSAVGKEIKELKEEKTNMIESAEGLYVRTIGNKFSSYVKKVTKEYIDSLKRDYEMKISGNIISFNFKNRHKLHFNLLSIFYLFAGFLGLFLFVMLNLKKGVNRKSTFLISLFVLLHSLFIIHLSLYLINCHYYFPHTLLLSTAFIFFYGPLIYFYFKITVTDYKLKWVNSLHLLPPLVLLGYIYPIYRLSAKEKFVILFNQEEILLSEVNYIVIGKIISLI